MSMWFCKRIILILGMLPILTLPGHARADDLASVIDLVGIPPPYVFNKFCMLSSRESWDVGGYGQIVHYFPDGKRHEQHPVDADLLGVSFVNSNSGWIVGSKGTILGTTDGGNHWLQQTSGLNVDLEAIACVDENHCWVVGRNGAVLRTETAGRDWRKVDVGLSEDLYAVDFINRQIGWAVGEDGVVVRTVDGGLTWDVRRVGMVLFPKGMFPAPANLFAVKFVDHKLGWVAGLGGIARTIDGGETWQTKLKRNSLSGIGLVCPDGKRVWAINKEGKNYYSEDAGETWKPYSTPAKNRS
ncbi:MAG TPA: YCF48-related protein [Blastocatellia bacterium]|nr:YCF48-related protein [Blastocatellia bacterium]